jgi:hypothetical protein
VRQNSISAAPNGLFFIVHASQEAPYRDAERVRALPNHCKGNIPIGRGVGVASTLEKSNAAPHLTHHDLRNWIEEARKLVAIKEIKGLSWQRDIGMVSEMALH